MALYFLMMVTSKQPQHVAVIDKNELFIWQILYLCTKASVFTFVLIVSISIKQISYQRSKRQKMKIIGRCKWEKIEKKSES